VTTEILGIYRLSSTLKLVPFEFIPYQQWIKYIEAKNIREMKMALIFGLELPTQ